MSQPFPLSVKLAVASLGLLIAGFAAASPAAGWLGQCEYYRVRNAQLGCASQDYLLAFGERYCEAFVENNASFSLAGQNTLSHLRLCLQQKLEERDDLTCENVKSIAASTHIECYVQNHFCQMSVKDKMTLASIIAPALIDSELRTAVSAIERECVKEHLGWSSANSSAL